VHTQDVSSKQAKADKREAVAQALFSGRYTDLTDSQKTTVYMRCKHAIM
jgi:hypothetical protein